MDRLSRRAQAFVRQHCQRVTPYASDAWLVDRSRAGVPDGVIERARDLLTAWDGLLLPPARRYDGGPDRIDVAAIEQIELASGPTWTIEIGSIRSALPYAFALSSEDGQFGLVFGKWVALCGSVEGWLESAALSHAALAHSGSIRRIRGTPVSALALDGMSAVTETDGLSDTWWRGNGRLIFISRGEAALFDSDHYLAADLYDDLLDTDLWLSTDHP